MTGASAQTSSPPSIHQVAIVGCGVIGAGWASRFLLNGINVVVSDPNPDAEQVLKAVFENAQAAHSDLGLPLEQLGSYSVEASVGAAVAGADFIQESVPERLSLKQSVFAEIESACPDNVIIASSTSGIKPTDLQSTMANPGRLLVGHPYNPVYLLPVVEVVAGAATSPAAVSEAQAIYQAIGMRPVEVRVEIDAFIGDRLLEAVWREALWMINDGVATTEEIDEVITHGFGLRWAQMGLFETYRVAGGPGGFRHFIEQFGPALDWPWTKLTDTPPFTPELIDTIVEQSDAQSGDYTVRELERRRDLNLVGFLKVLEANEWGAGLTLAETRRRLGR